MDWKTVTTKCRSCTFDNREEAIAFAESTMAERETSTNHSLLMQQDNDRFVLYERVNQPCYGEMRTYNHNVDFEDSPRRKDRKPGDLHDPFPAGNPIWVGVRVLARDMRFVGPCFDPAISPWRRLLPMMQPRTNPEGTALQAVVLTDTKVPPTPFIEFLMKLRGFPTVTPPSRLSDTPKLDELFPGHKFTTYVWATSIARPMAEYDYAIHKMKPVQKVFVTTFSGGYDLAASCSLPAMANGHLFDLDEGRTFYERQPYNRPQLAAVFGYKYAPSVLKDFQNKTISLKEADEFLSLVDQNCECSVPTEVCGEGPLPPKL